MTTAPVERFTVHPSPLDTACAALAECARDLGQGHGMLSRQDALSLLLEVESASRIIDQLQILAARLTEDHHLADSDPSASGSLLARAEQAVKQDAEAGPAAGTSSASTGNGFRDCADFLRATLRISRTEARRRLNLADLVLPRVSPTGAPVPPRLATLGAAVTSGHISGRSATVVAQALQRVDSFATPQQLESMEHHLTRQAIESDEDILRVLSRRWESVLDQDGQEPTEKVLRARQGVFFRGRRHGLHFLEIGATDEQFELLATVMNSTANPRVSAGRSEGSADACAPGAAGTPGIPEASGVSWASGASGSPGFLGTSGTSGAPGVREASDVQERLGAPATTASPSHHANVLTGSGANAGGAALGDPPTATRAQSLLDGLVAACRVAVSTTALPATGGHRPQVMVTIDYKDLIGATHRAGYAVFSEQMSARSIRKLACDADIIPLVLGSSGQVLDVGRAQRLFPSHLRRALVARDKGCAFPDCSIPASWCEAHHLKPWSKGGVTSIDNGVLLCSRHHHVIHQDEWTVVSRHGIPWFTAPRTLGPPGSARRNWYWQAGQAVDRALLDDVPLSPHEAGEHDIDLLQHSTR